ncbi:hypothetical protein [Variovorax sp. PAMC26660]|uniref:hypothetical protein n=1 Tax=Variovorax sp. PAMC26660 TaxID=2762322 RepID=UPI00164CE1BE|nr:hypothetical protein [Variovorax sp. PAMC26660]QNK66068.1 hypothetical protein H7F35_23085 [Variovorax sp. PAMC26660]
MARHRRVQSERGAVQWQLNGKKPPAGAVRVLLVRVSVPSATRWIQLDGDNLQGSMKAVRDQVAAWLGRDDADGGTIQWEYGQRRGTDWACEIHVVPTP